VRPAQVTESTPETRARRLAALLAAALAVWAPSLLAQEAPGQLPNALSPQAPPPPRILEQERAAANQPGGQAGGQAGGQPSEQSTQASQGASETPFAPQLAAPRANGEDELEEVIVVGRSWRLPDLGSSLRAQRDAERDQGRISVTFLPLYEPASDLEMLDKYLFFGNGEMQSVGFIDLFRVQFGRRSKE
jgi:hypothetical protein